MRQGRRDRGWQGSGGSPRHSQQKYLGEWAHQGIAWVPPPGLRAFLVGQHSSGFPDDQEVPPGVNSPPKMSMHWTTPVQGLQGNGHARVISRSGGARGCEAGVRGAHSQ